MKPIRVKPFKTSLAFYRTRHRTPGCKLTHMFGVPSIVLAVATLGLAKKVSAVFWLSGLALQYLGHAVFEKNEPTLVETHDLTSIPAAVVFVAEEWLDVIKGEWVAKNGLDMFEPIPVSPDVLAEAYTIDI